MTTEIVKQHDVTQIDKLVATFSKLDPAATAAKWEELDGAVEKSIVAIDQKFDALGANLIKVRAFLSQMENPGRKNIIEGIVGFANTVFSHILLAAHGDIAAGIDLLAVNPKGHPVKRKRRALVIRVQPILVPFFPEPPGVFRALKEILLID